MAWPPLTTKTRAVPFFLPPGRPAWEVDVAEAGDIGLVLLLRARARTDEPVEYLCQFHLANWALYMRALDGVVQLVKGYLVMYTGASIGSVDLKPDRAGSSP